MQKNLGRERTAATACLGRVWIVECEAASLQAIGKVNRHAGKVQGVVLVQEDV